MAWAMPFRRRLRRLFDPIKRWVQQSVRWVQDHPGQTVVRIVVSKVGPGVAKWVAAKIRAMKKFKERVEWWLRILEWVGGVDDETWAVLQ